jgi:hypothetical protein
MRVEIELVKKFNEAIRQQKNLLEAELEETRTNMIEMMEF